MSPLLQLKPGTRRAAITIRRSWGLGNGGPADIDYAKGQPTGWNALECNVPISGIILGLEKSSSRWSETHTVQTYNYTVHGRCLADCVSSIVTLVHANRPSCILHSVVSSAGVALDNPQACEFNRTFPRCDGPFRIRMEACISNQTSTSQWRLTCKPRVIFLVYCVRGVRYCRIGDELQAVLQLTCLSLQLGGWGSGTDDPAGGDWRAWQTMTSLPAAT